MFSVVVTHVSTQHIHLFSIMSSVCTYMSIIYDLKCICYSCANEYSFNVICFYNNDLSVKKNIYFIYKSCLFQNQMQKLFINWTKSRYVLLTLNNLISTFYPAYIYKFEYNYTSVGYKCNEYVRSLLKFCICLLKFNFWYMLRICQKRVTAYATQQYNKHIK